MAPWTEKAITVRKGNLVFEKNLFSIVDQN